MVQIAQLPTKAGTNVVLGQIQNLNGYPTEGLATELTLGISTNRMLATA